jgi:hypothetical protein
MPKRKTCPVCHDEMRQEYNYFICEKPSKCHEVIIFKDDLSHYYYNGCKMTIPKEEFLKSEVKL